MTDIPRLPYNGTSGWSGSSTSKERADRADRDGATGKRQRIALDVLRTYHVYGRTWKELADYCGLHHGQASGVLSNLHKAGDIARLSEQRDRCQVYVLPEFVNGRETVPFGRKKPEQSQSDRQREHGELAIVALARIESLPYAGYDRLRGAIDNILSDYHQSLYRIDKHDGN